MIVDEKLSILYDRLGPVAFPLTARGIKTTCRYLCRRHDGG